MSLDRSLPLVASLPEVVPLGFDNRFGGTGESPLDQ